MENLFTFNGKDYNIISENNGYGDICNWEEKVTDVTRIREIFAWRPWWVGNKFRWLKKIKIEERLRFVRYSEFDDGWSYQHYWKSWIMDWNAEYIID